MRVKKDYQWKFEKIRISEDFLEAIVLSANFFTEI
jgi:hypothetical protein